MSEINVSFKTVKDKSNLIIIKVAGELDGFTATEFDDKITKFIEQGYINIIIDTSEIKYISSAGIGVFMSGLDLVEEKNGEIVILNAPEQFMKVFTMMGFDDLFEFFNDEQEAINKFN
jgi:anti-sigma B factor antagonist